MSLKCNNLTRIIDFRVSKKKFAGYKSYDDKLYVRDVIFNTHYRIACNLIPSVTNKFHEKKKSTHTLLIHVNVLLIDVTEIT